MILEERFRSKTMKGVAQQGNLPAGPLAGKISQLGLAF
jgi:hypothetical protein